jgi:hypothetical protein
MSNQKDPVEEVKELFNRLGSVFHKALINNIVAFAVAMTIVLYISGNNKDPYVSDDIFNFMNILTNPCNKQLRGGSGISTAINDLSDAAGKVQNLGKTINKLTANVKGDIDRDKYLKDTLKSFTDKYCNETNIDEMDAIDCVSYVLHSSWLSCYNSIEWLNAGIIGCLSIQSEFWFIKENYYIGILIAFFLFIFLVKASSKMVATLIKLTLNTSVSKSQTYINTIFFSIFSSFLSVLILYFILAIAAYVIFLFHGIINVKSEQSSSTIRFVFGFLIIMIPALFGYNVTSSVSAEVPDININLPNTDKTPPPPRPPCNNTGSSLSQLIVIFIIPFMAAFYCFCQVIYRGLLGIGSAFDSSDMQYANKMKMIGGYFVFFVLIYTLWPIFIHFSLPTIIKSFGASDFLPLYYANVDKFNL